MKERQTVKTTL